MILPKDRGPRKGNAIKAKSLKRIDIPYYQTLFYYLRASPNSPISHRSNKIINSQIIDRIIFKALSLKK
jgi:hypothetical protein